MNPLISLAQKGVIQLFFVDASHFAQGGFVGQLWTKVRVENIFLQGITDLFLILNNYLKPKNSKPTYKLSITPFKAEKKIVQTKVM